MRNRTYGGVRGRKTKVGRKLLRFPPTRFVRLLVVEHIQILYLFEQTRKGIRMTRIRLKRERETLDAAGFAWSNPMYEARTLL